MLRGCYSLAFWAFLCVSSVALFPIAVGVWALTSPFDPRRVALHRFTCFWASLYTWLNPAWPLRVEGREKIDSREIYVMVSNHLSLLDILVLFRIFRHFKWVSKIENFRIPLIGWNMSLNRYIKLERGNRQSVLRMLRECEQTLRAGSSILMFPEGTRSPNGVLRDFKRGAFELALRARVAILPIVLSGTAEALPKRGFVLRGRHPLRIRVLDPLPYASFAGSSADEVTELVRRQIARELVEPVRERQSAAG